MFSQVCVKNCVHGHGRGACMVGVHGRGMHGRGGMCGRGSVHGRGACMAARCVWQEGGHAWQETCMAGEECILVKLLQKYELYWAINGHFLISSISLKKGSNLSKQHAFLWDFLFRSFSLGVGELFLHVDQNFSQAKPF